MSNGLLVLAGQRVSGGYDLTRDSPADERIATAAVGPDNAAAILAALAKAQARTINQPIVLPVGRFYSSNLTSPVTSGINLVTHGAIVPFNSWAAEGNNQAQVTRLVAWDVDDNLDNPFITWMSCGGSIGPLQLDNFAVQNQGDYDDAAADFAAALILHPNSCGLSIEGGSIPGGRITAEMSFMGFANCVRLPESNPVDRITFTTLVGDHYHTLYRCDNLQAVLHRVHHADSGDGGSRGFYFTAGGGLQVDRFEVESSNYTCLEIATYDYSYGTYKISNLRIDDAADDPVLLKLDAYDGVPRTVTIFGGAKNATIDVGTDAVQGVDTENDRVYIRIAGRPDLDAYSTVDSPCC